MIACIFARGIAVTASPSYFLVAGKYCSYGFCITTLTPLCSVVLDIYIHMLVLFSLYILTAASNCSYYSDSSWVATLSIPTTK